jgi:prolipoprotein diacylglyceryltransferase
MIHTEVISGHGGGLFTLFYLLGFLTMFALFILSGIKQKYPFRKLWLIASTGVLFFILGNKLFAIPPGDWKYLFTDMNSVSHGAKSMLGGLVGLIIGMFLVIRWLKMDARVADLAAPGLPLALAISRLGCLFAGCCYGTPADLPWAISYTPGHRIFDAQLANGLISSHDTLSLPVHPVQAYDIILCLIIALVIWKASGTLKAKGNRLLLAILLYGCARFFLEFARDPSANVYASGTWLGLNYVQWILAGSILILSLVIFRRERRTAAKTITYVRADQWNFRPLTLLMILVIIYCLLFNWLDPLERTIMGLVLFPAVIMPAWSIAGNLLAPRYRIVLAMVILMCLVFMAQTYIPSNDSTRVRFFEVGIGGLIGKYYTETGEKLYSPPHDGYTDCSGNYVPPSSGYYYVGNIVNTEHTFCLLGMDASYHVLTGPFNQFTAGLGGFYGNEKEEHMAGYYDTITGYYEICFKKGSPQFAVNPYINYDRKNMGVNLGFHLGNFRVYNRNTKPTIDDPANEIHTMHFYPQIGLRLGPKHILYLDARYCNAFPTCFPINQYSIGLASGFGNFNGLKIGAGYSSAGFYSTAFIPFREKYVAEISFTNDPWSSYEPFDRISFSIGFHYRFGYKTILK